jgi:[FeFe] hydrogenase H-cluster maturation GTPase HydF
MQSTPKSLRLHIGLFGRTNVGKSSFLNMIAGQDVAITSPVPGTTTDVVEKSMELLPVGPVVFLDTAGIDDSSELAHLRLKRTADVFDRAEIFVLITEAAQWNEYEDKIVREADTRKIPLVIIVNKSDLKKPDNTFKVLLSKVSKYTIECSSVDPENRDRYVNDFKVQLMEALPEERLSSPSLIGDLLPPGGLAILVVPIDLQAPKGRLILPQVQTIRDALDSDVSTLVVKEREYSHSYSLLSKKPDLVVCDSQIVMKMVADTPAEIPCTTFSILFSRYKGDLCEEVKGATTIESLRQGDKVLIAEACSHHAAEDDIGRVKIPRWLRQYTGVDLKIDVCSGRDYPENLSEYKLVIHCGACMLTRKEKLVRIQKAKQAGVAVTNYGIAISLLQGVLERALTPFPAALEVLRENVDTKAV